MFATLALCCVALIALAKMQAAPASAASPAVQDVAGTSGLFDVACPSASNCVAVGDLQVNGTTDAVVVPVTNGTPDPPQLVPGVPYLSGIACPSTTSCYAVGDFMVVPITNGTAGTPISSSVQLFDVACASPTACVAVGAGPAAVPITNGAVGSPVTYPIPSGTNGGNLGAVACPSSSGCSAYGTDTGTLCVPHFPCVNYAEFEIVNIGPDASYVSSSALGGVGSTFGAGDVSCPSTSTCYQTGTLQGTPFVLNWPTSGTVNDIQGAAVGDSFGIDCTSVTTCVGVGAAPVSDGYEGAVIGINNGQPSAPALVPGVSGTGFASLSTVSCPTASSCSAVGTTFVNGTQEGVIVSLTPPSATMLLPSGGSTQSGKVTLDSAAWDNVAVSSVSYVATGGPDNNTVISAGSPTLYGWLAQWNTTTVPDGTYTIESVATDTEGFSTTSAPITVTVDNPPPTTTVVLPSNGASLSGGSSGLDASASPNVSTVTYELSGGPSNLNDQVIATGTPTYYGWLASWNTTTVPNGTYSLVSVAAYPTAVSTTSAPITITVNNPPPTTTVVLPSNNASVSANQNLDATASAGVTQVNYEVSGGPANLNDDVIATGTPTLYGWLAAWSTTGVANGTYTLQSVASYGGGVSGTSSPITITVSN
jgi:hypothetical protein